MSNLPRKKLELLLQNVNQLPTLPIVYDRLQKALSNPLVSVKDVSKVIEQDQSLTSKLLHIVNSAYYGFPGKISSLSRAIVILGFNEVKHLTLSISVLSTFNKQAKGSNFDYSAFWKHSIAVAVLSGIIAKKYCTSKVFSHEEAFVAGLLHDIGNLIEDQYIADLFTEVLKIQETETKYHWEAEKEVMGFTHEEAGELLAEKWNLPQVLIDTIGFHHTVIARKSYSAIFPVISVVHLADIIAFALGYGYGHSSYVSSPVIDCVQTVGLKTDDLKEIVEQGISISEEMYGFLLPNDSSKEHK
jgi:putative nucleotidyltransferase with HDIG domain